VSDTYPSAYGRSSKSRFGGPVGPRSKQSNWVAKSPAGYPPTADGDSPRRDFENRLTSVMLPGTGGTVSFKYDPFGRRIEKVSSTSTTIYAYDGDNIVEQLNATGTATARYTQGLGIDVLRRRVGGLRTSGRIARNLRKQRAILLDSRFHEKDTATDGPDSALPLLLRLMKA